MSSEPTSPLQAQCNSCGFEAPAESDEWDAVNHPPLGTLTQCPGCGSTNVHSLN